MRKCQLCKRNKAEAEFSRHVYKGVLKLKAKCDICVQYMKDYRSQPDQVAKRQAYDLSPEGKAVQSRANKQPIRAKRQRDKRAEDKQFAMRGAMTTKINRMLRGGANSSKGVEFYTGVSNADDLMDHFFLHFEGDMSEDNYGTHWHVDHTIPCKWYSASEEDMKRCWSLSNMRPMLGPENKKKGAVLPPDEVLIEMGSSVWPVSWGGVLPTVEDRERMRMNKHH